MSSKDRDDDDDCMETNLDEVEIDEDGKIGKTSSVAGSNQLDEMETNLDEVELDAVDVDEDGNLRIHSAEKLLNTTLGGDGPSGAESVDGLSAGERRSLEKTWTQKRHYSGEGTPEEEKGMLAIGSEDGEDASTPYVTAPTIQGHDLRDIELSVFNNQGAAEESHPTGPNLESMERGEAEKPAPRSVWQWVLRIWEIIREFFTNMSPKRLAIFVAIVAVVIGIGLTSVLLPASFVYVEYHELALAKNRVTGKVNRNDVYYPGCYLLTPETTLVRFKGTAHIVTQRVNLQTSDRLTVQLGFSLQYFIKPEELGILFTNYEQNYGDVVDAVIRSTVKNQAGKFTLNNFRLNRSVVEQDFKQAIAFRLSGDCCASCCPKCQANVDCRSCRLAGRCYPGFHMEMRYFQMGVVDVPSEVSERFLRQTILLIEAERENFIQEHAVETKISQKLQKEILNKAAEVREAANADADKIRAVAAAEYEKTVQASYAKALKKMYQRLNLTQEDHKLSLMYIRALEDVSDNLYNINFDQLTGYGVG